ncbi:hypothetical protein [Spiroplasma monobiae]|uniref:Transmembrane protein n=1 Tax=Spiroplasma monobiae MQ-1 TaxID=1336748 RepID=A0A2K9LV61_SPISQ|nr:hypothetical protein [Spiroplasma monobiae]AUM62922.1 hypothetical protein SMONO_v1c06730 [Spiroplasma monobiae MQ-1]
MNPILRPNNGSDPTNGGVFFYDWQMYISFAAFVFAILVIIFATVINITVYQKTKAKKSNVLQKDLFKALAIKTNYTDIKLMYGERKRVNNHFNYRAAFQELHLPKWYEENNSVKGTMLMLYNFTNILDIREQATNFWSRSIYCHILAAFGVGSNLISYLSFRFGDYGALSSMNLSWFFTALAISGTILLIAAWAWWVKIFTKLIKKLDEITVGNLPEEERKEVLKMFKLQASVPFTVNTTIIIPRKVDEDEANKVSTPKKEKVTA